MLALTILGNNSAIPAFGRFPTAQILQTSTENFLIDCGEGTQLQIAKYKIRRSKINHIFISHLHGDHYFGLIGLLTSLSLLNRTQELHLYGPAALEQVIALHLKVAQSQLCYPLHFHPLNKEGIILNGKKMTVKCFPVQHRIECWGFLFREKKHPRKINPDKAIACEIPVDFYENLQEGEHYITPSGAIIANEEVTFANTPAKSYAYCADTIYDETLVQKINGVDMLYHETTYLQDLHEIAALRYHSTTLQAANIAKKGNVKKLLIGHFSSKYESLQEFANETCVIFKNTELAIDGVSYII